MIDSEKAIEIAVEYLKTQNKLIRVVNSYFNGSTWIVVAEVGGDDPVLYTVFIDAEAGQVKEISKPKSETQR